MAMESARFAASKSDCDGKPWRDSSSASPAARGALKDKSLLQEATVEHASARDLIVLLSDMTNNRVWQMLARRLRALAVSTPQPARVAHVYGFQGLERVPQEEAVAGDIVLVTGIDDLSIGCTITDIEQLKFDVMTQIHNIERNDHVIIVIDSIGNLASKKEVEDALKQNSAADMTRAKQLKSLFRMVTPHLTIKDIPMVTEMECLRVIRGIIGILILI